ncbi:PAS domain S-box protein [Parvularcula sp. ZS-1/3]|uniref:histidine kinase n=1 Tax=Parvularcula mediterranea TaxID=2732508 RepID=A0A7Y3RMX0_9PROT|nr:PAS domain S-box protein [Parvularcula mediterranea]NNU16511.1 PAS domain S-box protein [Parvularcula mediterranea]
MAIDDLRESLMGNEDAVMDDQSELQIALRNAVIDQALDCVVIIDGIGKIIEFNPAACRTFGYRREDVIGLNLANVLVPERFRQMHTDGMERFKRTGEGPVIGKRIEIEALCADGAEIPVELAITPVNCDGVHYFTAYLRDISLRLEAEEEVRASQNKYQNLFELSTDAIIVHTVKGEIVEFNSKAASLLGLEREHSIGNHVKSLHPDSAIPAAKAALGEVMAGREVSIETEFLSASGEPFAAELTARQVDTEAGPLVHGVVRDISERKQHEAERDRYEKLLAHAQRLAQVGSFEWEIKSGTFFWSPATYEIFGLDAEKPAPTTEEFTALLHPEDLARLEPEVRAAVATGTDQEVTHRVILHDGSIKTVETRIQTLRSPNGTPYRLVGTIQDITKVAEANQALTEAKEAAEAASIAKTQFLASMSHEMRTPLNGVIGLLDLLGETALTEVQTKYLEQAAASADSLLTLLSDLLDLSRIEAGEIEIERKPILTRDFIDQSVSVIKATFADRQPTIDVRISPTTPDAIEGDAARLRQVLVNLLSNAVKFTPSGEVKVEVDYDPAASSLQLDVIDRGIGIAEDVLPRLFDRFVQAHTGLSRRYDGAGLGLAICRDLCRAMGGDISASSTLGEGSRFSVSVPAAAAQIGGQEIKADNPGDAAAELLSGFSILIAEDSDTNALVVSRRLERQGAKVVRARDGREAVLSAQTGSYDVILMDVSMPEMDGLEATRALRALGGRFASVPIIALTAHALRGDKERCLEAGMNGYVSKPIATDELISNILRTVTDRRPSMQDDLLVPDTSVNDWQDDPELFAEVLEMFRGELAGYREALSEAGQAESNEVFRHIHSLKSSAGNVGALPLQALATELDSLSKDGRASEVISRLPNLIDLIAKTEAAIDSASGRIAS